MRKTTILAALGGLAAGAAAAGAVSAAAGTDIVGPRTLHVVDTDVQVAVHDVNKKGFDFGDIVTFRSRVADPRGHRVGHGIGTVTLLGPNDNLLVYTLILRDGSITMQGDITGLAPGAKSTIAVTGGTGRYANVRGSTNATQVGEGSTDLVIHLLA